MTQIVPKIFNRMLPRYLPRILTQIMIRVLKETMNRILREIFSQILTRILTHIETHLLTRILTQLLVRIMTQVLVRVLVRIMARISTHIKGLSEVRSHRKRAKGEGRRQYAAYSIQHTAYRVPDSSLSTAYCILSTSLHRSSLFRPLWPLWLVLPRLGGSISDFGVASRLLTSPPV
jgi:hypothetical protein